MKKAIIDLGTNTFNLLIGTIDSSGLKVEFACKEPVLLGMGGINEGVIAPDAMERAMETLGRYAEICASYHVESILGIGTSAMRASKNAGELVANAKAHFGLDIRIISGKEEAQFIYEGVSILHPFNTPGVIMDIGGGSTEFIHANQSGVLSSESFEIGVSRVYQMLGNPAVFTEKIQQEMDRFFEAETKAYFENLQSDVLIGASGSFETFYEMMYTMPFPKEDRTKSQMVPLPIGDLRHLIDWALNSTLEARMQHPWIVPLRKKMLPIAAYSIQWVLNKVDAKEVLISPYSLKEGAFLR